MRPSATPITARTWRADSPPWRASWPVSRDKDLGTIFKTVAMTLISTVGGASGPLYGTLFLQAVDRNQWENVADPRGIGRRASTQGLQGLMNRGKAVVGDKTMVDALVPAIEAPNRSPTIRCRQRSIARWSPPKKGPTRPCRWSPRKGAPVIWANAVPGISTRARLPPFFCSRPCSKRFSHTP